MTTPQQEDDQEDRPCLLPLTVLLQSHALATCLHARDLSRFSRSSHACQSFWPQVQSLHVPFFQYSTLGVIERTFVGARKTDGFRRACQQGQFINLKSLSLHNANLEDRDVDCLAHHVLPYLPQLEVLDLSHNPSLGYPGLTHLARSPRALPPKLRDLRLEHNSDICRGASGGANLAQLLFFRLGSRLECLDLTQTGLTDSALDTLSSFLRLLGGAGGTGGGDRQEKQPLHRIGLSGLRELRLGQNILEGRESSRALTAALLLNTTKRPNSSSSNNKSTRLEVLVLDDCYMGDEGLTIFAESALMLGQFWSLRELHLQNNRCGAGGAKALGKACLEGLPALEFLGLQMNMMGNEGALALVEGMVTVGEEGEDGREGGEARCLPRLKRVNLSHNMIDAVGVKGVLKLMLAPGRCPSLEEVDLSHNAVREKEAWELQNAIRFSSSSSTTTTTTTTTTTVTTDGTATITTIRDEEKAVDVHITLSPPAFYCQVLLEGEVEEEVVGGREGRERKTPDALMLLDWTMQSVVGMIKFAITRE